MHGLDPLRDLVKELGLKAIPFQGGVVALGDRILRGADLSGLGTGAAIAVNYASSRQPFPWWSLPTWTAA